MNADWNQESLEFILEHIRDAPEKQIQAIDTLDSKMIQIFAAASIVIGLTGFGRASGSGTLDAMPLVLALIAYISVAAVAIVHLWPKYIRWNLHADSLWPAYGNYDVEEIRAVLAQDTSEAYAYNNRILNGKSNTILMALIGTGLEVVLVGIAIAMPLAEVWFT